ncbi:MAG: DUF4440 domain-containing protein [Sphingobacteriaceae bacterium]|nr:MAG: DUF4440 domain-containing protein [Sphingobacteriaceae bacterium]
MKRLLFSTILFICYYCSAVAQDTRAVLAILEDQVVAWNRGDLDSFMDHYWRSDSLVFVSSAGPKYGWQTTLDNYKKSYPDKVAMGTLKFNILKITAINTTNVFVMGRWELKREHDNPDGYFTLWIREIDGDWKIAADHTSG